MADVQLTTALAGLAQVQAGLQKLKDELEGVGGSGGSGGAGAADTAIVKLGKTLDTIGQKATAIGQKLSLALTLPIAALGYGIIKTASEFEASMNKVAAVSGATGTEMAALTAKAKALGAATQYSASEAADAFGMLSRNGLSATEILNGAADATLELAAATGKSLPLAADVSSRAMKMFKIEAKDLGTVVRSLASAANASVFELEDFNLALTQGGGVWAAAGGTLDDFNKAIAVTSTQFASGSDAGTSFKAMITHLSSPSSEAAQLMSAFGVSIYDAQGKLKAFPELIGNLQGAFTGLTEQQKIQLATTIAGTDGGRALLGMIGLQRGELEKFLKTTADYNSEVAKAARQKGFAYAMDQLGGALENLKLAIADSGLLKWATDITDAVTEWVRWIGEANPALLKWGTIVLAAAAAMGPLSLAFGTAFRAGSLLIGLIASGAVRTAIMALSGAIVGLAGALTTGAAAAFIAARGAALAMVAALGPIGIGVAVVGALAGAYLMYRGSATTSMVATDALREATNNLSTATGENVRAAADGVRARLAEAGASLTAAKAQRDLTLAKRQDLLDPANEDPNRAAFGNTPMMVGALNRQLGQTAATITALEAEIARAEAGLAKWGNTGSGAAGQISDSSADVAAQMAKIDEETRKAQEAQAAGAQKLLEQLAGLGKGQDASNKKLLKGIEDQRKAEAKAVEDKLKEARDAAEAEVDLGRMTTAAYVALLREQVGKYKEGSTDRLEIEQKIQKALGDEHAKALAGYQKRLDAIGKLEGISGQQRLAMVRAFGAELERAGETGTEVHEQTVDQIKALTQDYGSAIDGIAGAWAEYYDSATADARNWGNATATVIGNFEDMLVDALSTGKLRFQDFVNTALVEMSRLTVRSAVGAIGGFITGSDGGGGGGAGGILGKLSSVIFGSSPGAAANAGATVMATQTVGDTISGGADSGMAGMSGTDTLQQGVGLATALGGGGAATLGSFMPSLFGAGAAGTVNAAGTTVGAVAPGMMAGAGGIALSTIGMAGSLGALGGGIVGPMLGLDATGSSMGGAVGAMAGAIIGSAIPVVGTVLGGIIGGALGTVAGGMLGNMLGGSANNNAQYQFNAKSGAVSGVVGTGADEANLGVVGEIGKQVMGLRTVLSEIGGTFEDFDIEIKSGNEDGFTLRTPGAKGGDNEQEFDSAEDLAAGAIRALIAATTGLAPIYAQAVAGAQDVEDAVERLKFAELYESLTTTAVVQSQYKDKTDELAKTYKDASEQAVLYGLDTVALTRAHEKAALAIKAEAQAAVDAYTGSVPSSFAEAMATLTERTKAAMLIAGEYGLATEKITATHKAAAAAIKGEALDSISAFTGQVRGAFVQGMDALTASYKAAKQIAGEFGVSLDTVAAGFEKQKAALYAQAAAQIAEWVTGTTNTTRAAFVQLAAMFQDMKQLAIESGGDVGAVVDAYARYRAEIRETARETIAAFLGASTGYRQVTQDIEKSADAARSAAEAIGKSTAAIDRREQELLAAANKTTLNKVQDFISGVTQAAEGGNANAINARSKSALEEVELMRRGGSISERAADKLTDQINEATKRQRAEAAAAALTAAAAFNAKLPDAFATRAELAKEFQGVRDALQASGKGTSSITETFTTLDAVLRAKGLSTGGTVGMEAGASTMRDSVLRWLVPGEFVVNRSASLRNRRLLEAVNAGGDAPLMPGFALGGLVDGGDERVVAAGMGGRGRTELHFHAPVVANDLTLTQFARRIDREIRREQRRRTGSVG